jgi:hypothetical protein
MSQHDYDIANALGATVRADINSALAAIVSQNSGASAPATTFAYMWWADTTTGLLKIRNAANSAWITVGTLASANLGMMPLAGGALTGALNEAAGADIASATTTDIGAATGNYLKVTGTTTITGLGTVQAGTTRLVRFAGALILTHNATSLILPGAASITTVADDRAIFVSLGSGNWICIAYTRADGTALASSASLAYTNFALLTSGTSWPVPAGVTRVMVIVQGAGAGGGGAQVSSSLGFASGGGVGYSVTAIMSVTPSGTVTYAIGAAGSAGSSGGGNGGNGGNTTFGSVVAPGGRGGNGVTTSVIAAAAAVTAMSPVTPTSSVAVISAVYTFNDAGVGGPAGSNNSPGCNSPWGTGGNGRTTSGAGSAATGYGASGGGAASNGNAANAGGAGAPGAIVVLY